MLENPKVNIKLKLAALWTSAIFCYLYGDYFELYTPAKVNSLITGESILNSPTKLLIATIIMAIPPLMVIASLTLKPNINRILNLVFGLLFTSMMLFIAFNSAAGWYNFYIFLAILESAITSLIVWYAFKWPRIY